MSRLLRLSGPTTEHWVIQRDTGAQLFMSAMSTTATTVANNHLKPFGYKVFGQIEGKGIHDPAHDDDLG